MRMLSLLSLLPFLVCGQPKSQTAPPKLVIVISVDQMKAEFFDWYGTSFTGGLKRLATEGALYTNAMLDYASSETAPGHATLATGSLPRTHGILGNEWTNPVTRKSVYCTEDSTAKPVDGEGGMMSPRNLAVTALGDWLKASSKSSRVISLAVKDRAAILMGGKKPDQVYWYDRKTAHLVTSSYYAKTAAPWVKSFNAGNWVFKHVPPVWNKVLPDSVYEGPDDLVGETPMNGTTTFPKVFTLTQRAEQMVTSPWGDQYILDAAREAIASERLGQRDVTDLLMIGLSCMDYVGHAYGPNSHEMQDHLFRLDGALGSFIAEVERVVGRNNMLIALSADHACLPLPEYLRDVEHRFGRRLMVSTEIAPKVAQLDSVLRREWGIKDQIISMDGTLRYDLVRKAAVPSKDFETRVRAGFQSIDGIADVYFKRELTDAGSPGRPFLDRFRNSYYAPRGEDFQVRFCEGCLPTSRSVGTSHGSAHDYDNHVPILFWGPRHAVNRIARPVRTVDVAVTIAKVLRLKPPKTVNGTPLEEITGK